MTIAEKLDFVHEELLKRYKQNSETARAQQMEAVLRYLKSLTLSAKKSNWAQQELAQMPEKFLNEITENEQNLLREFALHKIKTPYYSKDQTLVHLFYTPHKQEKKGSTYDDVLERGLNYLFQYIGNEGKMIFEDQGKRSFVVGREIATINLNQNILTPMQRQIMKMLPESIIQANSGLSAKKVNSLVNTSIEARSGKADIDTSTLLLTATSDVNSEFYRLQQLFAGVQYTVKNYKAYSWFVDAGKKQSFIRIMDISLGSTNLYKSVYGPLSYLLGQKDGIRTFLRAINSINNDENIARHVFHLRFIYELTGLGLVRIENDHVQFLKEVEFLIVNNPDTPDIYVRSTADIINATLNDPIQGSYFTTTIGLMRAMHGIIPQINIYKN